MMPSTKRILTAKEMRVRGQRGFERVALVTKGAVEARAQLQTTMKRLHRLQTGFPLSDSRIMMNPPATQGPKRQKRLG